LKNPYKEYAFPKPAKKKYIEKKYELRLGFKIFDMDHFLKCRWDDLQIIDVKGCQIDDKEWQKLITNIETFKFLE
jgi:Ca2+-binding EF-hand superfamily protein